MDAQIEKLRAGGFTSDQITVLLETLATKESVDSLAIEVETFSTDIDEMTDFKRDFDNMESTVEELEKKVEDLPDSSDITDRLDELEEYDLGDMEKSISKLDDDVSDLITERVTTFRGVWIVFLNVLKSKLSRK